MESKTFTFNSLPASLEELKKLPEADLLCPFKTVALTVLAFSVYPTNPEAALEMLEFLNGPDTVTPFDRSFIKERFADKDYVPRSYFKGATPKNNYTPDIPLTITVSDNPYSYQTENYATLYITSGGADNPRAIQVRMKPSTKQWFINEYAGVLVGIRVPEQLDDWA